MKFVLSAVFVLVAMLACDAAWLGLTMQPLYAPQMRDLLSPNVNLGAAAAFYVLYAVALSYLVIWPVASVKPLNWTALVMRAGVFGLAAYGTYDLTGLSVIRGWPAGLSLIDMAWGAAISIISATVAVIALRVTRQIT